MTSCKRPPRAVADLNAFLADVEERILRQRSPVPHDFARAPLPCCDLVDHCLCAEELIAAGMPCRKRGEPVPMSLSDQAVEAFSGVVRGLADTVSHKSS